jgi:CheY-like chemotaxis protein
MMKIALIILILVVGAVVGVIIGALTLELYIRRQTTAKLRQLFGPEYKREPRATEALAPRGRSLRILVVEDHADTLRVLGRLLNHFGHDISMADGAQSALQIVELKEFDVVLSDIGLPDGSGYEVIAQAKRKQPVKGIALTGLCEDEDIRRSREAGFDFHLIKPVDFHELRTILAQVGS